MQRRRWHHAATWQLESAQRLSHQLEHPDRYHQKLWPQWQQEERKEPFQEPWEHLLACCVPKTGLFVSIEMGMDRHVREPTLIRSK